MGCKNSAILAVLEIASLNEWKSNAQRAGYLDVSELVERANRIEKCLGDVLEQNSEGNEQLVVPAPPTPNEQLKSDLLVSNGRPKDIAFFESMSRRANISAITRIFACAALVYLNVAVYGPLAGHPKIHGTVSRTIAALKELRDPTALGILAWPLCIAGCMAIDWQMDFFRHLSLDFDKLSDVKSGNLKRSFLIMEECWRLRRDGTAETPGWRQAMESLDMKILLI